MLRTLCSSVLLCASFATTALAQAYGTDLLGLAGGGVYTPKLLWSLSPSGQSQVLYTFPFALNPTSLVHHFDNRQLVLNYTNPFAVVTFDPATVSATSTLHAGAPLRDMLSVRPWHTGDYLVAEGLIDSSVQLVRQDGSGTSTVFAPSGARIEAVAQDLMSGEILAALSIGPVPSLIRIDPRTGASTTLDPVSRPVTSLVQDHRDGAVYYGTADNAIFRWHPATGPSPFLTLAPATSSQPVSLAFDRATGNGILVAGSPHRITRIDFAPGGPPNVVAVHDQLPPAVVSAMDLTFRHGRNLSTRRLGPGNRWSFELSFPGEAGHVYVLALSLTGFAPGLPIDTRTVPLVPDAFFLASISGALAPLLQNNIGVLDPQGRGAATLDLSVFGSLAGLRFWAAVATLDAAAPSGIRTITKPSLVVLE